MIAVTFALPDESRTFLRALRIDAQTGRGVGSVVEGGLGGLRVDVWHVGVGQPSAAFQTARLIAQERPSVLVCAGYAGALLPELMIGDVVLDWRGFSPPPGYQLSPGIIAGTISTADAVAETPEQKRRLAKVSGAAAVDMETAAVARICAPANVPVIGLRSISDRCEEPLPVPMAHWFDLERQRPRVLPLLGYLATHPTRIGPFATFVRGLKPARENLARVLTQLIPHL